MRSLLAILIVVLFSGCFLKNAISTPDERRELRKIKRCNRKLDRLSSKCPELLTVDTIIVEVPITVDSIFITQPVKTNKDVSGVDSIIENYRQTIDSLLQAGQDPAGAINNLSGSIKNYIIHRDCITDTVSIDTSLLITVNGQQLKVQVKFGIYPQAGDLELFMNVSPQDLKTKIKVKDKKIVKKELTLKQRFIEIYRSFTVFFWIIAIISIALFILWFRKKFLI